MTPAKSIYAAPIGEPPAIQFVAVDRLRVDAAYQRSIETGTSRKLIERIAQRWDWRLCSPLICSHRPEGLYVIDGQHRAEAARLRGDIVHLPVTALFDLSLADEARIFAAVNHERKTVTRLDSFRAALAAGEAEAVTIARLVRDAGLAMATSTRGSGVNAGEIGFTRALQRALRSNGEEAVAWALSTIGTALRGETLGEVGGALFGALIKLWAHEGRPVPVAAVLARRSAEEWTKHAALSGVRGGNSRAQVLRDAIMAELAPPPSANTSASQPASQPASPGEARSARYPVEHGAARARVESARVTRPRTFDEQMAAVRAGATLVERFVLPRTEPDFTLGGVGSGML